MICGLHTTESFQKSSGFQRGVIVFALVFVVVFVFNLI
jgi:hypothetical protein